MWPFVHSKIFPGNQVTAKIAHAIIRNDPNTKGDKRLFDTSIHTLYLLDPRLKSIQSVKLSFASSDANNQRSYNYYRRNCQLCQTAGLYLESHSTELIWNK